MTLQLIWFILIFVLLGGYAILDGFDLGVGVLHLFTRDEHERRISINAIAPVWDGNEVWLLAGGGALFAAFPPVYATVFSGFYLALMLLLVAFILRAVSMEFRGKVESQKWRRVWDFAFGIGSLLPPVLLGVALGNVIRGVPITSDGDYGGTFLGLLNPYAILVGVFTLALFTLHGAIYLANKTEGEYRDRMVRIAKPLYIVVVALHVIAAVATTLTARDLLIAAMDHPVLFWLLQAVLLVSIVFLPIAMFKTTPNYARAFAASSCVIGALVTLTAISLFPNLLPSRTLGQVGLTIYNSSSTQRTLSAMLFIALLGMPLVIAYTFVIYRIFKGKVVLTEESY